MTDRARAMRELFDRGFAAPPAEPTPPTRDLLRIRLGDMPHAIALDDIAALHAGLAILALPTTVRELRGVVVLRGQLVPIYDLAMLLGFPPAAATARWIVTLRTRAIGLVFDGSDGHARVPVAALASGIVRFDDHACTVIARRDLEARLDKER